MYAVQPYVFMHMYCGAALLSMHMYVCMYALQPYVSMHMYVCMQCSLMCVPAHVGMYAL